MPPDDMLKHVLDVGGLSGPVELDVYMRHDVVRYGKKLEDLRKKMSFANSSMNGQEMDIGEDFQPDEHHDQIMSGNFLDDLGVDFLNLKEFGLDLRNVPLI